MTLGIIIGLVLTVVIVWAAENDERDARSRNAPADAPAPCETLAHFREFTRDLPGETPLRIRVIRPQLISIDNLEAGPDGIVIDLELPEQK
jgi:hypothetical protein